MAKRNSDQGSDSDKGRIRFVYAEVEGNNQSLQDLMKTMISTMNRPVQIAATPKRFTSSVQPAPSAADAEATLFNAEELADQEEAAEQPATLPTAASRQKRGEGAKTDRNANIAVVFDLDFGPDGKPSLKEFFAEKTPDTDLDQVLVLAHYLQHTLRLSAIGPGHILTAFKHVGKPVPVDLRQTIRNMKKGKAWLNFTNIEAIRVTTEGENRVEHELGQGQDDKAN